MWYISTKGYHKLMIDSFWSFGINIWAIVWFSTIELIVLNDVQVLDKDDGKINEVNLVLNAQKSFKINQVDIAKQSFIQQKHLLYH